MQRFQPNNVQPIGAPRHVRRATLIWTAKMNMNVSEFVWQRLSEWGLKRVYGYPGDWTTPNGRKVAALHVAASDRPRKFMASARNLRLGHRTSPRICTRT
jgi:hypothetical protein